MLASSSRHRRHIRPTLRSRTQTFPPVSEPSSTGTTLLPKRPLSHRWNIHDAKTVLGRIDVNGDVNGTHFEVFLPLKTEESTGFSSLWYMYVRKLEHFSKIGLCISSETPQYKEEVTFSKCTFSIINSGTKEAK